MKTILKIVIILFLCTGCGKATFSLSVTSKPRLSTPPKVIYINKEPVLDVVNDNNGKRVIVPLKYLSLEDRYDRGTIIRYNGYIIHSRYKLEYFLELIQDKNVPLNQE